jgi:hypothetical protein
MVMATRGERGRFGDSKVSPGPDIVGRTIRLTGTPHPYAIVGVAAPDFLFPYKAMLGPSGFTRATLPDLWLMLPPKSNRMVDAAGQPVRSVHFLAVIGRLKPGASLEAARAELAAIAARRASDFPDSNDGWRVTAVPLHTQVTGQIRPVVLLLFGGVALLLIMMCLNIANVLLARASGRQRDVAVRAALGASLGRLVQQFLDSENFDAEGALPVEPASRGVVRGGDQRRCGKGLQGRRQGLPPGRGALQRKAGQGVLPVVQLLGRPRRGAFRLCHGVGQPQRRTRR